MKDTFEDAVETLSQLGFSGPDIYLAELIPLVETAWADGQIQPSERALLEAICVRQTRWLNEKAGVNVFSAERSLQLLHRELERRLTPHQRQAALIALEHWWRATGQWREAPKRLIRWANVVARSAGLPRVDTRELFWLRTLERTWAAPAA